MPLPPALGTLGNISLDEGMKKQQLGIERYIFNTREISLVWLKGEGTRSKGWQKFNQHTDAHGLEKEMSYLMYQAGLVSRAFPTLRTGDGTG